MELVSCDTTENYCADLMAMDKPVYYNKPSRSAIAVTIVTFMKKVKKTTIKMPDSKLVESMITVNPYEAIQSIARTVRVSNQIKEGTDFGFTCDSYSGLEILILNKALNLLGYTIYYDLGHEIDHYSVDANGKEQFVMTEIVYPSSMPYSEYEKLDDYMLQLKNLSLDREIYLKEVTSLKHSSL